MGTAELDRLAATGVPGALLTTLLLLRGTPVHLTNRIRFVDITWRQPIFRLTPQWLMAQRAAGLAGPWSLRAHRQPVAPLRTPGSHALGRGPKPWWGRHNLLRAQGGCLGVEGR